MTDFTGREQIKNIFYSIGLDPAILIITVIKIDKKPTSWIHKALVLNVIQKYGIKNNECTQLILSFNSWNLWNAAVKDAITL